MLYMQELYMQDLQYVIYAGVAACKGVAVRTGEFYVVEITCEALELDSTVHMSVQPGSSKVVTT